MNFIFINTNENGNISPGGAVTGHWVKHGMEWIGMEWNGMEWNGLEWNGMEWNSIMSSLYLSPTSKVGEVSRSGGVKGGGHGRGSRGGVRGQSGLVGIG